MVANQIRKDLVVWIIAELVVDGFFVKVREAVVMCESDFHVDCA